MMGGAQPPGSGPPRGSLPADRALRLPEEIVFFARSAVYALLVAVAYWFLTYETAGTVLLGGFGVASTVLVLLLLWKRPQRQPGAAREVAVDTGADGPFGNDRSAVPSPTLAPIELGFGLAVLLLTVPFGPAMAIASAVPLLAGAIGWLRAVEAEPPFRHERREEDTPVG